MRMLTRIAGPLVVGIYLASSGPAVSSDRPAAQILAEIDAIKPTRSDPKTRNDPAALKELMRQAEETQNRRDDLIWELYKAHPDHERVPKLLGLRWMHRVAIPRHDVDDAMAEIERVLAESKGTRLATDVAFLRAEAVLRKNLRKGRGLLADATLPAIEDAVRRAPKDPRGAKLLFGLITAGGHDLPQRTRNEVGSRLLKDYPDSPAATLLKKAQNERNAVGKPFVLEFTDAIKGAAVSTKDLRGKVVVVHFWATWCGACVTEMPKMKELYAKYHAKGIEVIGVSCDRPKEEGGLDRLREFVARNGITWPQYYQGGAGEGTFSNLRGVLVIPTVFVVDRDGNLASADAQDKLDELIPALMEPGGQSAKD